MPQSVAATHTPHTYVGLLSMPGPLICLSHYWFSYYLLVGYVSQGIHHFIVSLGYQSTLLTNPGYE